MPHTSCTHTAQSRALHVLIAAPEVISSCIKKEYATWTLPRLFLTCVSDPDLAIPFLSGEKRPAVDLLIVGQEAGSCEEPWHFLKLVERRGSSPAIVIHRSRASMPLDLKHALDVDLIEQPFEVAEVVAATAELLCFGAHRTISETDAFAVRERARNVLAERLATLRTQRARIRESIDAIERLPAAASSSPQPCVLQRASHAS